MCFLAPTVQVTTARTNQLVHWTEEPRTHVKATLHPSQVTQSPLALAWAPRTRSELSGRPGRQRNAQEASGQRPPSFPEMLLCPGAVEREKEGRRAFMKQKQLAGSFT